MVGIFGLTWLTTKFLSKRLPGGGKTSKMQIIEKLTMGKDRQVVLLKVGEEHFMVGVAGQQISFSQPVLLNTAKYSDIQEKVYNDQNNSADNSSTEEKKQD